MNTIKINIPGKGVYEHKSDIEMINPANDEQEQDPVSLDNEENESQNEPENITLDVNKVELYRLKTALKQQKKMLNAQTTMITKEITSEVCDMYQVDRDKLLWLATFGEKGFNIIK